MLNPLIFHFMSGDSFYSGSLMLAIAVALSFRYSQKAFKIALVFLMVTGLLFIVLAGNPLGPLFRLLVFSAVGLFTILQLGGDKVFFKSTMILRGMLFVSAFVLAFNEWPWRAFRPVELPFKAAKIYTLGGLPSAPDAKKGASSEWALNIKDELELPVIDLSRPGAAAADLAAQTDAVSEKNTVVFLMSGMQDKINGTPVKVFREQLFAAVAKLSAKGAVVVLFDIPSSPDRPGFAAAFRDACLRYRTILVPKHVMASLYLDSECSSDGVTLNEKGNILLAAIALHSINQKF